VKPQDLLSALKQARLYMELRIDLCPPALLFEASGGSTIQSIAAIYAHSVVTEDSFVQRQLRGVEPLYESARWASRIRFPPNVAIDADWARTFRPDMTALREYAGMVYGSTGAHLSSAPEEAMSTLIPKYLATEENGRPVVVRKDVPLWFVLTDDVILHTSEHTGEISAILGVRGLEGSPAWELRA
jgi:hypothetical protein